MSVTVVFGFVGNNGGISAKDFLSKISPVIDRHGFGFVTSIEDIEKDIQEGMRSFARMNNWGWDAIAALRSPKSATSNTAYDVYKELYSNGIHGEGGLFLDLTKEVIPLAHKNKLGVDLFLGEEWSKNDLIRYLAGTLEEFIELSSIDGGIILSYI